MPKPGWYNENTGRDFPFVFGRSGNANYTAFKEAPGIVVDFGCIVGINGDFVEGEHSVWLHAARKTGNYVDFEFYSDAPGLANHKLVFSRDIDDEDYEIEYAEAVVKDATSLSIPPEHLHAASCPGDVLWEGFLVTKDVPKVVDIFGVEQEVLFGTGALNVEPGLLQNLAGHYLRTINCFNGNRTRAERPAGCRPWCWPSDDYTDYLYFPAELCLEGDIRLAEGYNCSIEEDRFSNTLTVHAIVGRGLGEPSTELSLFDGETPPSYGSYFDGSVGCNELLRSINGVEGPHVELVAGQGVTVETLPDDYMIIIHVDMQDLAGCFEQEASTSLSELPAQYDDCACGPD